MLEHVDESGQPCTRHAPVSAQRIFELAAVGSRTSGFHHDAASKMQSLMMSLDEISELATDAGPELRTAIETAHTALRELNALFTQNRQLAKTMQRARGAMPELLARAAERVGATVRGAVPSCEVRVNVPAIVHALAMLLDVVAGPSHLGRVVDVTGELDGENVTLALVGPREAAAKPPLTASESIALASFVIARDDGEVRCCGDGERFVVRMPVGQPTAAIPMLPKP
jgi:hypothetical protein